MCSLRAKRRPFGRRSPASGRLDIKAVELSRGSIGRYDCVVIITDHKAFDYAAIVAEADVVVDTRNAIKQTYPHVFRLGAPRPENEDQKIAAR